MERLTRKRVNGISTGYWSPAKKQELVDRLALYENAAVSDEDFGKYLVDITEMSNHWKKQGLSYMSRCCQLLDVICGIENDETMFTVKQIRQMVNSV